MKMIFEKAGKTYVFEKATVKQIDWNCSYCENKDACHNIKMFDVEVWLYCIGLMPTLYICTEVIDDSY